MSESLDSPTVPAIPEATDRDLFITRAFDAPREVVWRFFTEARLLAGWFGPAGIHADPASAVVELRPGGRWDLDMIDPANDRRFPVRGRLTAVQPPEYLEAVIAGKADGPGPRNDLIMRLWLHDHGSKTRLTLHQGPFAQEFRELSARGWAGSLKKLDRILDHIAPESEGPAR